MNNKVDNFRLKFANDNREFVPIMIGGMGVDISTSELALTAANLGGIGHISDALITDVSDRKFETSFVADKRKQFRDSLNKPDKSRIQFNLFDIREATRLHIGKTMEAKQGSGLVFVNCMEKLTMNNTRDTLQERLNAALDHGIDGITLSAGLHLNSMAMMAENKRFHDAKIGIIVSSVRALKPFLQRSKRVNRLPDFIVVEGPLAGGHLGFALENWHEFSLPIIFSEVLTYLRENHLDIPVIPAGGIFTGSDAASFLADGAAAVQVATRFTITKECGLTDKAKQEYLRAQEEDVIVNTTSPTGYPMRMLRYSPSIGGKMKPNCESLGYLLENGTCSYIEAYERAKAASSDGKTFEVFEKTCLCTHMQLYQCYTCGHYVYRLKDTTNRLNDGSYQILSAEHVFKDYQYSMDNQILKPQLI
jgi:NAD(P)H-dependent flavin oxidoreductase YrpB (nitropropane dioxygenase family)